MNKDERDAAGPYGLTWLDSSWGESLLPGTPWHKIKDEIASRLAVEVRKTSFSQEQLNQALCQLLGKTFAENNHLKFTYASNGPGQNETYIRDAREWLQSKIQQISHDTGCHLDRESSGNGNMSRDMISLCTFVQKSIQRGMEKELSAVEHNLSQLERKRKINVKESVDGQSPAQEGPESVQRPEVGSCQSEALGKAVGAILQRDQSKLERICRQLYGKQLPNSLRQRIWKIRLTKGELPSKHFSQVLTESEKKFANGVARGIEEFGLLEASSSPIERVIKHVVEEMYYGTPGLGVHVVTKEQVEMAVSTLNCFYVCKRNYEPRQILLLYPLICTFGSNDSTAGATPRHLAYLLAQLLENCFPSRVQLFALADCVIDRLAQEDGQLLAHLVQATKEKGPSDPKEFLLNFIHSEKEQAQSLERSMSRAGFETLPKDAKDLLCHPIMFLRKWIGEGFVSVLGCSAVLLVWDQCFLSGWQPSVLHNTCLVLLQLLRQQLMDAADYREVKRVFLEQPSGLYTCDIQQGLVYLENGGAVRDVTTLRQVSRPPSRVNSASLLQAAESASRLTSSASSTGHPPAAGKLQRASNTVLDTVQGNDIDDADNGQPHLGMLWAEQTLSAGLPEAVTNRDQFDVYIDEVRFVTDNATIIKVTGRILGSNWQKPENFDAPDVEAFPELDSPARCPQFKYKYPVEVPSNGLPVTTVLLLRVYTLDVNTGQLVVIGNCVVGFYSLVDDQVHLRVGGFQVRMKHTLPSSSSSLNEETFADLYNIPSASVLVRLLPRSEDFVEPPGYGSGYYHSESCKPTKSETRVYDHYCNARIYPPTVKEAIYDVREGEEEEDVSTATDAALLIWYKDRLAKHRLRGEPASLLDLTTAVMYDEKVGIAVKVEQAFGLPAAMFTNALVYINSGTGTVDGLGGDKKMVTSVRSFDSQQKSPRWLDEPTVFHQRLDPLASVVIRLYAVDGVYSPRADHAGPGSVSRRKDQDPVLVSQGWTVLQLFKKNCVNAGTHRLPLLQDSPSSSFMEFLTSNPADHSFREAIRQKIHQPQGLSSVVVRIWDAHFTLKECIPLPLRDDLLSVGKPDKYRKAAEDGGGKPISRVVLNTLSRQVRKEGTSSQHYVEEKGFYEDAMNSTFCRLLENVLLQSGLGPVM